MISLLIYGCGAFFPSRILFLESALEANADLFITADQSLINRLRHALQLHPENSIIEMANKICGTPFQALIRLEATFS